MSMSNREAKLEKLWAQTPRAEQNIVDANLETLVDEDDNVIQQVQTDRDEIAKLSAPAREYIALYRENR